MDKLTRVGACVKSARRRWPWRWHAPAGLRETTLTCSQYPFKAQAAHPRSTQSEASTQASVSHAAHPKSTKAQALSQARARPGTLSTQTRDPVSSDQGLISDLVNSERDPVNSDKKSCQLRSEILSTQARARPGILAVVSTRAHARGQRPPKPIKAPTFLSCFKLSPPMSSLKVPPKATRPLTPVWSMKRSMMR